MPFRRRIACFRSKTFSASGTYAFSLHHALPIFSFLYPLPITWGASSSFYAHWSHEPEGHVSLSPGERVGVRGKARPIPQPQSSARMVNGEGLGREIQHLSPFCQLSLHLGRSRRTNALPPTHRLV